MVLNLLKHSGIPFQPYMMNINSEHKLIMGVLDIATHLIRLLPHLGHQNLGYSYTMKSTIMFSRYPRSGSKEMEH